MKRRDYAKIAAVLRNSFKRTLFVTHQMVVLDLMNDIADALEQDNPYKFNRNTFLRACGHPDFQPEDASSGKKEV